MYFQPFCRQRPGPLQKPHVEVPQKAGRKVSTWPMTWNWWSHLWIGGKPNVEKLPFSFTMRQERTVINVVYCTKYISQAPISHPRWRQRSLQSLAVTSMNCWHWRHHLCLPYPRPRPPLRRLADSLSPPAFHRISPSHLSQEPLRPQGMFKKDGQKQERNQQEIHSLWLRWERKAFENDVLFTAWTYWVITTEL